MKGVKRENTIKSRKEILEVLKTGKKVRYPEFEVYYKKKDRKGKFAVLVGLRNGNAVERNRLKRIYREVYSRENSIKKDKNYIIFKPGRERDREKIYRSIRDFLKA